MTNDVQKLKEEIKKLKKEITLLEKSEDKYQKMFTTANETMLKEERNRISQIIAEYLALEMIRKPLSDCLKLGYDIEATLDKITKATPVQRDVAEELIRKYRIMKLLTLDTDTGELNNQLKQVKDTLKNINDFVLSQYGEFK